MDQRYDFFVIFAGMRTGSNFLEANLNAFEGLACHGEAFNPNFVCYPDGKERFGFTLSKREADPLGLIEAMRGNTDGLAGFRFFRDHDPRVLAHCLSNRRCAKIVLTRNPLESYLSWKIAKATGQWKLTDARHKKTAKAVFNAKEFSAYLVKTRQFSNEIRHALQTTGQTAFHIDYQDVADVSVLNGLARFLGLDEKRKSVSGAVKKQNPNSLRDKVQNPAAMEKALSEVDFFSISQVPSFEPTRGPVVPSYLALKNVPLIYLPVMNGTEGTIRNWLENLDDMNGEEILTQFNQKALRQWKRRHPGHRSFTVVRHPVARAHSVFRKYFLLDGTEKIAAIREKIYRYYKLKIPDTKDSSALPPPEHKRGFLRFLGFLKSNLSGQTSIRVDPAWASQTEVINGFANFTFPDLILRAEQLRMGLDQLAEQISIKPPEFSGLTEDTPFALSDIYDEEIETAVRDVYQRDYMMFGYPSWEKCRPEA